MQHLIRNSTVGSPKQNSTFRSEFYFSPPSSAAVFLFVVPRRRRFAAKRPFRSLCLFAEIFRRLVADCNLDLLLRSDRLGLFPHDSGQGAANDGFRVLRLNTEQISLPLRKRLQVAEDFVYRCVFALSHSRRQRRVAAVRERRLNQVARGYRQITRRGSERAMPILRYPPVPAIVTELCAQL